MPLRAYWVASLGDLIECQNWRQVEHDRIGCPVRPPVRGETATAAACGTLTNFLAGFGGRLADGQDLLIRLPACPPSRLQVRCLRPSLDLRRFENVHGLNQIRWGEMRVSHRDRQCLMTKPLLHHTQMYAPLNES